MTDGAAGVLERLCRAVNDHDLDGVVECFAETYRNVTPTHPSRGFVGNEQVRANWQRIFVGVPDVRAEVVRIVGQADADSDDEVVWSEWEMRGIRGDGAPHLMRGVIIFGVADERVSWARFYLEPVDQSGDSVDDAIAGLVADRVPEVGGHRTGGRSE